MVSKKHPILNLVLTRPVFGFPNSPELPNTGQNLGFYDQCAGLEWVQRNIAQFGGDPNKVTIFGESAGAVSVDALVTSFAHNPPFRAAIMQSGQISVRPPFTNSTTSWLKLAAGVGCPTGAGALCCMRSKDASAIESVVEHQALTFSPIPDGVSLVANPAASRAAHKIANVPILIGNDAQESRSPLSS
jgi:carboxylesterase type B